MLWQQLVFITDPTEAEQLSVELEAMGASAVTLEDAADQPLFESAEEKDKNQKLLWDQTRVIALFDDSHEPDVIISALEKELFTLPPHEVLPLKDQNWEQAWMSRYGAMCFSGTEAADKNSAIWVCPSWVTPPEPDAINLILDPGMAFGTGTHETTAMCLEWLARSSARIHQKKVIDYGCGSGILAIAAAKLGAGPVWAIDIEQQSLDSTRDNAWANQVEEHLIISGPASIDGVQADVLIANILANPLMELAADFAEFLPQGEIVLSGILTEQVAGIKQRYEHWFEFSEPCTRKGWALLAGQRRTP